jgi:hypothetical protein
MEIKEEAERNNKTMNFFTRANGNLAKGPKLKMQ